MRIATNARRSLSVLFFVLVTTAGVVQAGMPPSKARELFQAGEQFERQADWDKACECYDLVLRIQRDFPQARERHTFCLRRCWQALRHRDVNYRKELLDLDYSQALRLFTLIRDSILDQSVDRKKLQPTQLFRRGLEELDAALKDSYFREHYIPAERHSEIPTFREYLARTLHQVFPASRADLLKALRDVAMTAQTTLQLSSSTVVLEVACGSCYAVDEYSLYLTPFQLRELCQNLKGETVGTGLSVTVNEGHLVIAAIAPASPAAYANPPLERNDRILAIDQKPTSNISLEEILGWLEGPADSMVQLDILSANAGMRTVTLRRRALALPTVAFDRRNDRVAYLHISSFQENTLAEVDLALSELAKYDARALVLDLRGNHGGLFDTAIEVARRFLTTGVITSTQHQDGKLNKVFHANNPNAITLPLLVLVDGDTASAAEVLAGALKENARAKLLGQRTFGKGCTQLILKLPNGKGNLPTGGIRLTVARFYSPKGQSYTPFGIEPDFFVEREALNMAQSMAMAADSQLEAAFLHAERLLASMPR